MRMTAKPLSTFWNLNEWKIKKEKEQKKKEKRTSAFSALDVASRLQVWEFVHTDKKRLREINGGSESEIPDRDGGQAIQKNLPHCLECTVVRPSAQPTLSAPDGSIRVTIFKKTRPAAPSFTEAEQLLTHLFTNHAAAYPFHSSCYVWVTGPGKKGKRREKNPKKTNNCHKYPINKEKCDTS